MTPDQHLDGITAFLGGVLQAAGDYLGTAGADPAHDGFGHRQVAIWADDEESAALLAGFRELFTAAAERSAASRAKSLHRPGAVVQVGTAAPAARIRGRPALPVARGAVLTAGSVPREQILAERDGGGDQHDDEPVEQGPPHAASMPPGSTEGEEADQAGQHRARQS